MFDGFGSIHLLAFLMIVLAGSLLLVFALASGIAPEVNPAVLTEGVEIDVNGGYLTVRLHGLDRLWALKRELTFPLAHVTAAERYQSDIWTLRHASRTALVPMRGVPTAGTCFVDGEQIFVDTGHPQKTLMITLTGEDYQRLIVAVDDPEATLNLLHAAAAIAPAAPPGSGNTEAGRAALPDLTLPDPMKIVFSAGVRARFEPSGSMGDLWDAVRAAYQDKPDQSSGGESKSHFSLEFGGTRVQVVAGKNGGLVAMLLNEQSDLRR